ncbi:MAG: hypothetical protein GAK30_00743 [Paracidovorax wautersii]|uniref:4'-phosphopantetheinyl transferase domain-containing protein n=1 Tax=Paracidovorax wautersii TaxID=1177982 RepID=A0A7V8FR55_9BURK|nr:MAG: hypothetical protein GAK30_00743 [Paracidovorax wautersii]
MTVRMPPPSPSTHEHPALFWGVPEDAGRYKESGNNLLDQTRDRSRFSPRREQEWRVSRALLQAVSCQGRVHSLSHSHGHAVVATAPAGWLLGVDLERVKPRRVHELAEWCCDDREQQQLQRLPASAALRHFYRLWTFKEAMIKACDLEFPADLKSCSLWQDSHAGSADWQWDLQPLNARGRPWFVAVHESEHWTCSLVFSPPRQQHTPPLPWRWLTPSSLPEGFSRPMLISNPAPTATSRG